MFPPAAVLFWLNYKAAYDNWNEQRLALNKDIHVATKEVVDKLPGIQQTSAQAFSTLFLQLTVNDLGICLPITNTSQVNCYAWFWSPLVSPVKLKHFYIGLCEWMSNFTYCMWRNDEFIDDRRCDIILKFVYLNFNIYILKYFFIFNSRQRVKSLVLLLNFKMNFFHLLLLGISK